VCKFVLYCTVLYFTVLYCTVLYCTVLYCTVLYCTVLYCTVLVPPGGYPIAVNKMYQIFQIKAILWPNLRIALPVRFKDVNLISYGSTPI